MKLDIGCGKNKKEGYIGVDKRELPGVDVVCDIEKEKLPFPENSIDEIYTSHTLEHIENLFSVLDEFWRICKKGAKIKIIVPYFTSVGAFQDPSHKRFFTFYTFDYFTNSKAFGGFDLIKGKFKIISKKIKLNIPPLKKAGKRTKIKYLIPLFFQYLINKFPNFYEKSIFRVIPASELEVELEVIK